MKQYPKWQKLKKETLMFLYELMFYLELFFSLCFSISSIILLILLMLLIFDIYIHFPRKHH